MNTILGVSGMFQYFIKIVPTTYKGEKLVKSIAPNEKYNMNEETNEPQLETNRYFTTERFTPLMMDIDDEHWDLGEQVASRYKEHHSKVIAPVDDFDTDDYYDFYYERQEPDMIAGAKVGGNTGTSHQEHENHRKQQSILPGIFFIYQIYPFAVEISQESVPLTHLFIRILSTIGGVFTILGMVDALISSQNAGKR